MYSFNEFDDAMPVNTQSVTVFRLRDNMQAKSKGSKKELALSHQDGDEYFAAWTGQWSTSIFKFPKYELFKFL